MSAPGGGGLARVAAGILSERGLGALISIILIVAIVVLGSRLIDDVRAFQQSMLVEAARTNEQLTQIQIDHAELRIQMDRIERQLLARSQP